MFDIQHKVTEIILCVLKLIGSFVARKGMENINILCKMGKGEGERERERERERESRFKQVKDATVDTSSDIPASLCSLHLPIHSQLDWV